MAEKKKVKPPVEQLVDADARKKALKMALDQISKQFGKDAILSMAASLTKIWMLFLPAPLLWTWHSASAVFPADVSLKFTDRNLQVKLR